MSDFFEIDFLDVASKKSGDAIPLRYSIGGVERIHVTDGGFKDTGDKIIEHINKYYGTPDKIDSVIVSHSDNDHTSGLGKVLETFTISELWMLRPWLYAEELIGQFSRYSNVENLVRQLKKIYPRIAELEKIADDQNIPILAPFQGEIIGEFKVLAPTKTRYLELVVESDKTPEATGDGVQSLLEQGLTSVKKAVAHAISFIESAWGEETFSPEGTSPENEMSVVQYAKLCEQKILLTGDAGRCALTEAADYAPFADLILPGIDRFQVPHHGSRRNLSTEILDRWLGEKLPDEPETMPEEFTAIISASKEDDDHPRKAVVRACIHRGAKTISTEGADLRTHKNAPPREGWTPVSALPYPEEQEED